MKIVFGILTLIILSTQGNAQEIPAKVNDMVAKHQVLLKNHAQFKGYKKEMYGASAFLLNYRNKVYAVTAKHLLGEGMDFDPPIKIQDLNKRMIFWKLFPRVPVTPATDTVVIGPAKLNYDALDKDILLLEVANNNYNAFVLTPNFNLPAKGEKLYLIGCPYSQKNCKQNIYEITYDSYDAAESTLGFIIKTNVNFSGFSGAPIVNANGEVVAILTVSWDEGKNHYVGGTFIKEIEKVK